MSAEPAAGLLLLHAGKLPACCGHSCSRCRPNLPSRPPTAPRRSVMSDHIIPNHLKSLESALEGMCQLAGLDPAIMPPPIGQGPAEDAGGDAGGTKQD